MIILCMLLLLLMRWVAGLSLFGNIGWWVMWSVLCSLVNISCGKPKWVEWSLCRWPIFLWVTLKDSSLWWLYSEVMFGHVVTLVVMRLFVVMF